MGESSTFEQQLFGTLMRDCYEFQRNNIDYLRYGVGSVELFKTRLKEWYFLLARRRGFSRRHFPLEQAAERLAFLSSNIEKYRRFYELLGDDYSRRLLIDLLRFKVLGSQHVRLPLNTQRFWDDYQHLDKKFLKQRDTLEVVWNWRLSLYEYPGVGGPIALHSNRLGILQTFMLEQYAYRRSGRTIEAEPGDVVVDGGGCYGDTALYFADRVGESGRVYCFEFDQDNLKILEQCVGLNPRLKDRIKVVRRALWDNSEDVIRYCANGPGTSLAQGQEEANREATTMSVDDLVREEGLTKVDYIKMDIEGSEFKALRGAEKTLREFRPKLAVSLYHRDEDFIVIPEYINSLNLQYEFYLDHFTIHREETVLFAVPRA